MASTSGVPVKFDKIAKSFGVVRVLEELSLDIQPGEFLVLLGASGSGKTTALRILAGLETASSGRITIDGQDVSGISLQSLRSHISVVSQEAFLFNGTIRENILYGQLDASLIEFLQ